MVERAVLCSRQSRQTGRQVYRLVRGWRPGPLGPVRLSTCESTGAESLVLPKAEQGDSWMNVEVADGLNVCGCVGVLRVCACMCECIRARVCASGRVGVQVWACGCAERGV